VILHNTDLSSNNTFGLPVTAATYARVSSFEELRAALDSLHRQTLPLLVLGGGSNFLFVEPMLRCFVIQPVLTDIRYTPISENEILVTVGAGVSWHTLVIATLDQDLCGLENLALIPGSVGAAPIQNIGAYGVELADHLVSVQAIEVATGNLRHFHKNELKLGYRDSVFKREIQDRYVITEVTLLLHRDGPINTAYDTLAKELAKQSAMPTARRVAEAVMAVRRARLPDPAVLGNAGSFFKNPVVTAATVAPLLEQFPAMPNYPQSDGRIKLAAGWLIEQAGMKGITRGRAGTHESQALVIVNRGGATGAEILGVAREVRDTVRQRFAVTLEPEVWIVGAVL